MTKLLKKILPSPCLFFSGGQGPWGDWRLVGQGNWRDRKTEETETGRPETSRTGKLERQGDRDWRLVIIYIFTAFHVLLVKIIY